MSEPVVLVHGKAFEKFLPSARIQERIKEIAAEMNKDLAHLNPVFLAVLNGAFFFAADLLREVNFTYEISFVKIRSYAGMRSGQASTLLGLDENIRARHVVVVEDIIDTGRTMNELHEQLEKTGVASIRTATLICKPDAMQYPIRIDYKGFDVPNDFLVGYGLDYDKQGRNYRDIYKLRS